MWNSPLPKIISACMLLAGLAMAQEKAAIVDSPSQSTVEKQPVPSNRKAYDALYSDILKTLPKEGQAKVDSARGRDPKTNPNPPESQTSVEVLKKNAAEKRRKELDELPPEVKARVDKALSDLDKRRKEKEMEFKEIK